ncbi:hypothetical protein FRX31_021345, partial [Thalictrum thalictroides]
MKPLALALFLVVSITICRGVEGELTVCATQKFYLPGCTTEKCFEACLDKCRRKSVRRKYGDRKMHASKMH